ncbi:MAG: PilZ domain-containing protein [Planctomycetes bacterium]|nr:PilZ domain-containing protein [Planctomycetota bacterium]
MSNQKQIKRAFRMDCAIFAKIGILDENGKVAESIYPGLISNVSESGCKVAVEDPTLSPFTENASILLEFDSEPKLSLNATVIRNAEVVDGWGFSAGVKFTRPSSNQKRKLRAIFLSESGSISKEHRATYRQIWFKRKLKNAAVVFAAIIIGIAGIIIAKKGTDLIQRQATEDEYRTTKVAGERDNRDEGQSDGQGMITKENLEQYNKLAPAEQEQLRRIMNEE